MYMLRLFFLDELKIEPWILNLYIFFYREVMVDSFIHVDSLYTSVEKWENK